MALLRVKRPSPGKRELSFQGRRLSVGAEIDTRDFPKVGQIPGKWAQLVRVGIFHDDHLNDPELVREVKEQREQYGSAEQVVDNRPQPVAPIDQFLTPQERAEAAALLDKPLALQCGDCGFHATSSKGLKTHITRKHQKG